MTTQGGHRTPFALRATSLDDGSVLEIKSLFAARKKIEELAGRFIHHATIKRWASVGKEAYGYKWEMVEPVDEGQVDDAPPMQNVFTFRECMEAIFNGGKVRVTTDTPRRVSVFDVIQIVIGESCNPRATWKRLCDANTEIVSATNNYLFPGARGAPTPVTDANGVMLIVNALPGRRAQQFRVGAMDVLVRFLGGDQSLHDEIDDNARRQAELPSDHPMQIFTDEIYANPQSAKYLMSSPLMKGKYISEFYNKPVVYLLEFEQAGKKYVKVGWTMDFKERIAAHFKELPGCTIYCVIQIDNPSLVEADWKNAFGAFNSKLKVNGNMKTELFTGISIEEGEQYLVQQCEQQKYQKEQDKELEKMKFQAQLEEKRMAHELEMKRLELQILQAQLTLKQ